MAELVIGVTASGVTIGALGAQITIGIVKLKSFLKQVKDVPKEIQDLIEELDMLRQLLADADEDQQLNPISSLILNPKSRSQCLDCCRDSANQPKVLIDDLAKSLGTKSQWRKKWSSAKIIFRKDEICRFKSKLKRSIRLLSLSLQLYQGSVPLSINSKPPGQ